MDLFYNTVTGYVQDAKMQLSAPNYSSMGDYDLGGNSIMTYGLIALTTGALAVFTYYEGKEGGSGSSSSDSGSTSESASNDLLKPTVPTPQSQNVFGGKTTKHKHKKGKHKTQKRKH